MDSAREQVQTFLNKCGQLKKSKFIMATTRIKDLLKCIVTGPVLYELFQAATARFDYISAKRRCLVITHEGFFNRGRLVLPDSDGEKLAFIFCLLVEFDHGSINFNEFLQQFFPEDGGYYVSFRSFCDSVIVCMENILRNLFFGEEESETVREFPQPLYSAPAPAAAGAYAAVAARPSPSAGTYPSGEVSPVSSHEVASFGISVGPEGMPQRGAAAPYAGQSGGLQASPVQPLNVHETMAPRPVPGAGTAEKMTAVAMIIAYERDVVTRTFMPDGDKRDGICMLDELEKAVRESRSQAVYALLRGYEYYSACHNNFSQLPVMLRNALGD